jgi:hypothetical protein
LVLTKSQVIFFNLERYSGYLKFDLFLTALVLTDWNFCFYGTNFICQTIIDAIKRFFFFGI